ncbi:hypothetical protein PYCCODRAFT_1480944 [Trametes coccinea BRFM310]|uniref:Uncharacterized protein n=1 Tax=Trametes coccinea (strain BRFM310) TaxID=1353009 RepID=A0A1Y2IA08_TRAC3|nr:hypothetical protein PYCCODRAFT_1480944 [Trametes coccinea BRFM310]
MMRWSSNPEANYVMIEPNVKFMLYTAQARANPPLPYWERPPPTPQKPVPIDKIRFLPTRRLQDAIYRSGPWQQVVADDLDSFSHVMLHAMLFRGKKRRDGSTDSLAFAYRALNKQHPKVLMDWRDEVEESIWRIGERVKKERAEGKEPDGATIDAIAEQLYAVFRINIRQHSQERELSASYNWTNKEDVKDRWKKQYEDYLTALDALAKAADDATTRKEEARRLKAEQKALKKAQKAEEEKALASKAVAEEPAKAQAEQEGGQDIPMEVQDDIGKGKGKATESVVPENSRAADREDRDDLEEPAAKRARLD